jgi:hypothetical protein
MKKIFARSKIIKIINTQNQQERESLIQGLKKQIEHHNINEIDISHNEIGPIGATYLAEVLKGATNITSLNIFVNNIGDEGAIALALVLKDNSITNLHIAKNKIGKKGIEYLAEALRDTNVTEIDISYNEIGSMGAMYLGGVLSNTRITTLHMMHSKIGSMGAGFLVQGLKDSNITYLNLYNNNIGDEGAIALAAGLKDTNITTLDIGYNNIGNEGAIALAAGLKDTSITELNLWDNPISDEGLRALAEGLEDTKIITMNIENIACDAKNRLQKPLEDNIKSKEIADELLKYLVAVRSDAHDVANQQEESKASDVEYIDTSSSEKQAGTKNKKLTFKNFDVNKEELFSLLKIVNKILMNDVDINNVAKFCGKYSEKQISEFFNNIGPNLAGMFNSLSVSENIKIIQECIDTCLNKVAEEILSDRKNIEIDKDLPHPSAYALMDNFGALNLSWFFSKGESGFFSIIERLLQLKSNDITDLTNEEINAFVGFVEVKLYKIIKERLPDSKSKSILDFTNEEIEKFKKLDDFTEVKLDIEDIRDYLVRFHETEQKISDENLVRDNSAVYQQQDQPRFDDFVNNFGVDRHQEEQDAEIMGQSNQDQQDL